MMSKKLIFFVDQISHKNAFINFLKEETKENMQVKEIKKFPIREINLLPNNIVEIPLEQIIKEEPDLNSIFKFYRNNYQRPQI